MVRSQFWYSIVNGMSGQKFYNEWAVNLFNTLYTAAPIVVLGTSDKDIPAWIAERMPILYRPGIQNASFRRNIFWEWTTSALMESGAICTVALVSLTFIWYVGRWCTCIYFSCFSCYIQIMFISISMDLD